MVNVSKKYLSKELQTKAWSVFLHEIKKADSPEVLRTNLKKFLTASEITMLEKRLSISILIKQNLGYRTIGAILDVSPTTISFVKHNLTKSSPIHRKYNPNKEFRRKRSVPIPSYKGVKIF